MRPIEIVSLDFLILTLITLVVYYLLSPRFQTLWLLAVSYAFYATWGWGYLAVLVALTMVNFEIARRIQRKKSKALFIFGLALNALSLLTLKALSGPYGFDLLAHFVNEERAFHLTAILLPIGFSFYVLQAISYLTDVYRGQIPAEENFFDFALYMAYFPKMLAGPIERAKSFLPQIKNPRIVDVPAIEQGIYLILLGLVRKLVIADRLTQLRPADIFSNPENYSLSIRILWLLVFAFALYNDFAGYTSIVRGVSSLLGIHLSENFRQPFFSRSFSDFWTRWHISLSEWLRDYIFYPTRRWLLSHKWNKWLALLLPPLITMLVSGYWHGAYLSVLGWGFSHGLFLAVEQILQQFKLFPRAEKSLPARLYAAGTSIAVTLTWIPFASSSLRGVMRFLFGNIPVQSPTMPPFALIEILLAMCMSLWLDWQGERLGDSAFLLKWSVAKKPWGFAFVLVLLLFFANTGNDLSGFVYQGF